jgi:hypothetical protein
VTFLRQIYDDQLLNKPAKRSQGMDALIAERMTRAREKDEQSLRLFNQLRDRRGANVRTRLSHKALFTLILISLTKGWVSTYRGCFQREALRIFRVYPAKRALLDL